jgi:colanic acid/amylovoran biosynthesis protein
MSHAMRTVAPRILIQSGCYELDNLGDQSMLQAAIDGMRERLPNARFSVLSRSEDYLKRLAPDAHRVPVENRTTWKWIRSAYIGARSRLPNLDPFVRRRFPEVHARLLRLKARSLVNHAALRDTQFIVLSGGGYFTDVFPGQAWSSLERIRAADAMGIPFAIVGHGFGPLRDAALRTAARELIPRARLISIREKLASLPILKDLGVDTSKVLVTGDDAVAHAWRAAKKNSGRCIGVNLRVASYAGMTDDDVVAVRDAIRDAVATIDCDLIPLAVCLATTVESESDASVAARILDGLEHARIDSSVPATVGALIDRISECRLVVTGSYHCAVFALSQGIPSVCIHHSEYYALKFRGLADQFKIACAVIDRSDPAFHDLLRAAILESWRTADELRPELLPAAEKQVEAGSRAYDALCAIITAECDATPSESRGTTERSARLTA